MTIRLWDTQTGGQVDNPLQGHISSVLTVAFCPDGRHIVSGTGDKTVQIWDAQIGGQVALNPLQGHISSVWSVAFSLDGRHIVSGSWDKTIQLWDAQTGGKVGNPLQGHTDSVKSVAFSPDGRHIVSSSWDKTIQLWDAQTGDQVGNDLNKQTTDFLSSTFSPIHFSSSATHGLYDAQSLFVDMSDVSGDCRDLIHLQNDGWIVGPNGKLLLWVPPSYHKLFLYTPWTHLVIPRGSPELDLSKMAHGPAWHRCYTPLPEHTN